MSAMLGSCHAWRGGGRAHRAIRGNDSSRSSHSADGTAEAGIVHAEIPSRDQLGCPEGASPRSCRLRGRPRTDDPRGHRRRPGDARDNCGAIALTAIAYPMGRLMSDALGRIETFVGTGAKGYAGDGGPALRALCNEPFMCAFDTKGNLYVSEAANHCVRRIDKATGVITTVAGTGVAGYSGDGGPATRATLNQPYSLQIDANGDIYIVDRLNAAIRKIAAATGSITTVAGTGAP